MISKSSMNRRRVLRGAMGGAAVTVGLPFLDCFLDVNGTALADGTRLPVCFGTWFWGLGFNPGRWEPKVVGPNFEMAPELEALAPFKHKVNVYSGMNVFLDGKQAAVHNGTGPMQGGIPSVTASLPSIDSIVADTIGTRTRFRSLEVTCDGRATSGYSRRGGSVINPSETSPVALYARIFGPEFKDPNAADFTPDPGLMVKRSALSAITEQRVKFRKKLGAADQARLDEYFTSLRELEQKLDLELQRPEPLAACSVPSNAKDAPAGAVVEDVQATHKLFAQLLAHALACGQTQVINVVLSPGVSILQRAGNSMNHHIYSHEEPIDPKLGYQPNYTYFVLKSVEAFRDMLVTLDGIREGDGTLLDRIVLYAATDTGFAKIHSVENVPILTAGGAGGRIKTGIHVAAKGDSITRVGLTVQQALGVPIGKWGTLSNQTSKTITEIMAS